MIALFYQTTCSAVVVALGPANFRAPKRAFEGSFERDVHVVFLKRIRKYVSFKTKWTALGSLSKR